jgi:streptogramin lyase
MRVPHWLRPLAARLNPIRNRPLRPRPAFRPRVEGLEERTVPSVTVEEFTTLPAGISQPAEMQTAPDGSVWFNGANSSAPGAARNVLARISSYGEIQDFVVPFSMSNFVFGLDGNIWIGSNTSIHEVTPQGRRILT